MTRCLINLIASPDLEDALVEWLLERSDVPGFSSMPVAGHGSSERSMTLAEQVAGRSRQVLFQLELPRDGSLSLMDGLRRDFAGSGLHYWVIPVTDAGRLD